MDQNNNLGGGGQNYMSLQYLYSKLFQSSKSFCKWLYTCKYVVALSDYSLPLHAWSPHLSQFTVNAVVLWPVAGGKGVSVDCSLHVLPLSLVDPIDQGRQMKPISLWKLGIVLDTTLLIGI